MSKALIIDDEVQLRRLLRMLLEARGYETVEAATAQAGIEQACISCPDVVLLDLGLPDSDGVTVLRRLREWTDVPVLVLSVRNQESVKVAALEAGADDYVTKPFGAAELLARLQAIQRRGVVKKTPDLQVGELQVNLQHHEVRLSGQIVKFTPTEFGVVSVLAEYAGRVVTQNQLVQKVWGNLQANQAEGLRVHINHIRKKLDSNKIKIMNEPGIGYRLLASGAANEDRSPAKE
jgi:two-component system KDP operon response regulator KdpE